MKKAVLWGMLLTVFISWAQAEVTPQPTTKPVSGPGSVPVTQNPTTTTTPSPKVQTTPAQPAEIINCEYKMPPKSKKVDPALVQKWSEKAVVQAFDFDSSNLEERMQKLKLCFTEQGWEGFNTALEKSGNLEAIKTQQLKVNSSLDGPAQITESKENQWNVSIPLHVIYQNDKEKINQLLNVTILVGRKMSGDLGIAQMVTTPRTKTTAAKTQP